MSKNSRTVASSEPWKEIRPFLLDSANQISGLAQNNQLTPFVQPSDATLGAIRRMGDLGRNNPVTNQAMSGLRGFMGQNTDVAGVGFGDAIGPTQFRDPARTQINYADSLGPTQFRTPARTQINYADSLGPAQFEDTGAYAGIDAMRNSISARVLPQVAGMFGQGGFANSTMAQQTAADALGNALAGFEYNQFNTNRMRDDGNTQFNTQFAAQQQARGDANQEFNAGLRQDYLARNDANRMFNTQLATQQQARGDANQEFNAGLRQDYLARNDANRIFNTQLATQQQARGDQNAIFNQGVAAQNMDRGLQRDLAGLGLAPTINTMQFADIDAIRQAGASRDAIRQAREGNASANVQQAANLFAGLAGLGGTNTQTGSPGALQTLGGLGQFGANAALAYGALGGGLSAGAGGAFGAGSVAASPALAGSIGGISSLLPALPFCDRRLKRDIERTPLTLKGLALYTFRYFFDAPDVRRIGPMADEAPKRARIVLPSGYLAVDMGAL